MSAALAELHADVAAARNGDTLAFERVVRATQGLVSSIAFAAVRDRTLSEEVAQDALIVAWRKLPQLRNPAAFLPWLRELTRNLATSRLRAPVHRTELLSIDEFESLVAQAAGPGESLQREREAALLASLLEELDADLREPLLLFYREGESSQQVAALLGLSDAAVRKRLSRARQALRAGWLERAGQLAVVTAPAATWSATVMSAVALGSAKTAGAATLAAAGAKGGAAGGLGTLLLAALPGVLGGLLGVVGGVRGELLGVEDEVARREILRTGWHMGICVLLAALGIAYAEGPALAIAAFGFLLLALAWLAVWRMHRIRREHLRRSGLDADQMRSRLQRRLLVGVFGLLAGGLCGGLGLWLGGSQAGWW